MSNVESAWKAIPMTKQLATVKVILAVLAAAVLVACGSGPRAQHYTLSFTPTA